MDWLAARAQAADAEADERDESWQAFMAERRARKEKERLRRVEQQRTAERRAEQTDPTFLQRQNEFVEWLL